MTVDVPRLLAILVAALALPVVFGGLRHGSSAPSSLVPVHTAPSAAATLSAARLDVADATGFSPAAVALLDVRPTTWDGCLGVKSPGRACAALAVSGLIARFEVDGRTYRYHLASDRYLGPIDRALADDGATTSAPLTSDAEAVLAYYARSDLARRNGADVWSVTVETVAPAAAPIAAVITLRLDGHAYLYDLTAHGSTALSVAPDTNPTVSTGTVTALEQKMRADLGSRLHIAPGSVSILSYIAVRWSDACLGIEQPGQVCAQAVTPGFEATLLATSGNGQTEKLYTYRGANNRFVAADFLPASKLSPAPIARP